MVMVKILVLWNFGSQVYMVPENSGFVISK